LKSGKFNLDLALYYDATAESNFFYLEKTPPLTYVSKGVEDIKI